MMKSVKYDFAMFVAAGLLTGCAGDLAGDTGSDLPGNGAASPALAVNFSVSGDGTTRTPQGTQTLSTLRAQGFGVFAAHHGIHPYESSSVAPDFMWNQRVAWDDANGAWTYEPLKYWPAGDGTEENREYITFFAYAPYGEASDDGCIADFSKNGEAGDPWLVYRLGGTSQATDGGKGWQERQQDLLYAFTRDQQRQVPATRVPLTFRHALAGAGDQVTVVCHSNLRSALRVLSAGAGQKVTLTLNALTLDYTLVGKARLTLNGSDRPNWQPVISGDITTHRYLTLTPDKIMAEADEAASDYRNYTYRTGDLGIFYIPITLDDHPQTVRVTADYSVRTGASETYRGSTTTIVMLDGEGMAGKGQDFQLTLGGDLTLK